MISGVGQVSPRSPIAAIAPHADRLEAYWVSPAGAVLSSVRSHGSAVTGGVQEVAGSGSASPNAGVAAVARINGHVDVFWVAPDGAIVTSWRDQTDPGGWLGHAYRITDAGAATADGSLVGIARNPLHLDVVWVGPNGRVRTTWWDANDGAGWRGHLYEPALADGIIVNTLAGLAPHEHGIDVCGVTGTGAVVAASWTVESGRIVAGTVDAAPGQGGLYFGDLVADSAGTMQLTLRPANQPDLAVDEMAATSVGACRHRPAVMYAVAARTSSDPTRQGLSIRQPFRAMPVRRGARAGRRSSTRARPCRCRRAAGQRLEQLHRRLSDRLPVRSDRLAVGRVRDR